MRHRQLLDLIVVGLLAIPGSADAQQTLPYTGRRLSFTGLSTSVRGDIRTVGMGGATVGLADTFIAAIDNPAGLAMTVGLGDIHFATNDIHDGHLQSFDSGSGTDSIGLAFGFYPWAVSFGYLSRYDEGAAYRLRAPLNNAIELGVTTRELVLSAARVFFHNRLSLGVGVLAGQAVREVGDRSFASYTGGVSVGATVQLPRRLLLGASFSSPLRYDGAPHDVQRTTAIPGFFQPVEVPWRVSLGLGFIPNRFFRADLTLHLFTATPHTALVRDEAALVGQSVTLQPHLGTAYVFADLRELKATLFTGIYYEWSRIAGTSDRVHGTAGVEARIWIFTVGAGVDVAEDYRNVLVSVGVDVFGVLARLAVIPKFWTPPSDRMFPRPFRFSDDGLARPLVEHWAPTDHDIDPIKVALKIPSKLAQGLRNAGVELRLIGKNVAEGMEATNLIVEPAEAPTDDGAVRAEEAALRAHAQLNEEAARLADARRAEMVRRIDDLRRLEEAKRKVRVKHPRKRSIPKR